MRTDVVSQLMPYHMCVVSLEYILSKFYGSPQI